MSNLLSITPRKSTNNPISLIEDLDYLRLNALASLNKDHQAEFGQYFTPPSVARLMAGMFSFYKNKIKILDPGAGVGNLTAALVSQAIISPRAPKEILVTAFEVDSELVKFLEYTLKTCKHLCNQRNIDFSYQIIQEDFINVSTELLLKRDSLFPVEQPNYDYAILNPPYKKINNNSHSKQCLKSMGIDTTNLYSAFVWLTAELLAPNGEMVAIIPRSFCNGTYFKSFRKFLLSSMAIKRIHIFETRNKAFKDSNVLQENIIVNSIKTKNQKLSVEITSNDNPDDVDIVSSVVNYDQLVEPKDADFYIRIIPNQLGHNISIQVNKLPCILKDLGISVSTGKVVDFRSRDLIRETSDTEMIPLIYPNNFRNGYIDWPSMNSKKPSFLASQPKTEKLTIPSNYYVLLKRFSSKEEKRRLYAAMFDPEKVFCQKIGIENHINYFHRRYGGLSRDLAKGLTAFLNSSLVDLYFRQFSGHTQVNAADLRSLRYPTASQLISIGQKIDEKFPDQDGIDIILNEVLTLNSEESMILNPIQAKKKIKEAFSILLMLNVPKAQQNDRPALTLLALANIIPSKRWNEASPNLIGITEMMDFFRDHYGTNYAPNTRETVRRQTIHQFMQMGLVDANPDDSTRPINSPKTRYLITPTLLDLVKSFESPEWKPNLTEYLKNSPALQSLQVRERIMPMIPVNLPNGEKLLLSSGGQNELIKQVIEEFCPRYTPGGNIIYIGDAGEKINDKELEYFEQLGIKIDKHGKMPDLIIELTDKKWLVLIEAVTSHGPIDIKRHNELQTLFGGGSYGLVFLTTFESRKIMNRYLAEIAWETEVWVAEAPSHLIHFNGERFLGPY